MSSPCSKCGEDTLRMPAKAVGGGIAGATIGSVVPVIGTGLGAILGGIGGGVASAFSDNNRYAKVCSKCRNIEWE